ncbi:MAG: hypothetical protein AAF799_25430 [Myxococcota bacterium]
MAEALRAFLEHGQAQVAAIESPPPRTPGSVAASQHELMSMVDDFLRHGPSAELEPTEDRVKVPSRGSLALACGEGLVMVHGVELEQVCIDYDEAVLDALLRVDHEIELHDGDSFCAGLRWFRYEAETDDHAARVRVFDADGVSALEVPLHAGTFTIGRERGDLVLEAEAELEPAHFEIHSNRDVVLRNLAGPGGTWLALRSGSVTAMDCTISVSDRLLRFVPTKSTRSSFEPAAFEGTVQSYGDDEDTVVPS